MDVNWVKWILKLAGFVCYISAAIWIFVDWMDDGQDTWRWFSRFALGIICFGFLGVIQAIEKRQQPR